MICHYEQQALASEKELVLALLDPDAATDVESNPQQSNNGSDNDLAKAEAEADLTFVLDRIFEGVCRPFKVRVEQVLQSQPNVIVAYKLSNTLEFYSYTVSRTHDHIICCCFFFFPSSPFLIFVDVVVALIRNGYFRSLICLGEKQLFLILYGCSRMLLKRHSWTF